MGKHYIKIIYRQYQKIKLREYSSFYIIFGNIFFILLFYQPTEMIFQFLDEIKLRLIVRLFFLKSIINNKQTRMNNNSSQKTVSSNSFFFILQPNHFKVQHAFAKNMKSGTLYRLSLFKGVQSLDAMKQPIKGKLVGGKIIFQQTILNFGLPLYSPARNVQFTVKILQTKPNEQQKQLTQFKIKSGDYIQSFKNNKLTTNVVQILLLQSFSIIFTLFLHNSKLQVDRIYQETVKQKIKQSNKGVTMKRTTSEVNSQSQREGANRNGSSHGSKRIVRKRGHGGKLKSRASQDGDSNSQRSSSVSKSNRRALGKFPHTQSNEHYIHSPPKEGENNQEGNIGIVKKLNYVTVNRKDSGKPVNPLKQGPGSPKIGLKNNYHAQSYNSKSMLHEDGQKESIPISSPSSKNPLKNQTFVKKIIVEATDNIQIPHKDMVTPEITPAPSDIQVKSVSHVQYNIKIRDEKFVSKPQSNKSVQQSVKSIKTPLDNQLKQKGKKASQSQLQKLQSLHLRNKNKSISSQIQEMANNQRAVNLYQTAKNQIMMILFFVVSILLMWNAMTPKRRI